jgi:hypothetical protein
MLPTYLRLRHRAQSTIFVSTLYPENALFEMRYGEPKNTGNNIGSYVRFPLAEALKTMNLDRLNDLETMDPRPLPPWRTESFTEIENELDRESARDPAETVRSTSDIIVYSDVFGQEGHLGAVVVALDDNLEVAESK